MTVEAEINGCKVLYTPCKEHEHYADRYVVLSCKKCVIERVPDVPR